MPGASRVQRMRRPDGPRLHIVVTIQAPAATSTRRKPDAPLTPQDALTAPHRLQLRLDSRARATLEGTGAPLRRFIPLE